MIKKHERSKKEFIDENIGFTRLNNKKVNDEVDQINFGWINCKLNMLKQFSNVVINSGDRLSFKNLCFHQTLGSHIFLQMVDWKQNVNQHDIK